MPYVPRRHAPHAKKTLVKKYNILIYIACVNKVGFYYDFKINQQNYCYFLSPSW
jgi:PP-loop superfamily ATP-utilizing enzyme